MLPRVVAAAIIAQIRGGPFPDAYKGTGSYYVEFGRGELAEDAPGSRHCRGPRLARTDVCFPCPLLFLQKTSYFTGPERLPR